MKPWEPLIVPIKYEYVALASLLAALSFSAPCRADEGRSTLSGNISWYGPGFNGKKTASGEIFDMNKLTCAHKTLPFGTRVLVENPKTGKSVIVKVNDRGPYAKGRIFDLSRGAAQKLGILLGGVTYVECTILPKGGAEGLLPRLMSHAPELPETPGGIAGLENGMRFGALSRIAEAGGLEEI